MLQVQKTSEELALCHSAVEKKIKEWTEEVCVHCAFSSLVVSHVTVM